MIAIIDYGVGNLFSVSSSLRYLGLPCEVTDNPVKISNASHVILPGVGAFGDAVNRLRSCGLDQVVQKQAAAGKPLLGICLGMQLLLEESSEYGKHLGLGLIPGSITDLREALADSRAKVPQMGWNSLRFTGDSPLLKYIREGNFVYYVHSYYAPVTEYTMAASEYGGAWVTGITSRDNVHGAQFHPEKSGKIGLDILRAFSEIKG